MVVVIKIRQPARLPQCETGSQCHMLPLLALRCTPAASKDAPSIRSRARSAGSPFSYDPASVADSILSIESPGAVYESGVTGFPFCREPRCLGVDCVIGAVSKMQRPAADKRRKTDKRDAEFSAKQLALHEIVEVHVPDCECEGARDLSQAPADARERLPCYRQAAPLQVPTQEWAVPPRRRRPEKEARDVDQGALGLDRSRGDGRPHGPADPRLL